MASFSKKQPTNNCHPLDFWGFVYDRQEVWHNRYVKKMPRPWTTDLILHEFKFCEIYRENDRCSKYLINKIINNNELRIADKILNILVFRIYNQDGLFDVYFKQPLNCEDFQYNLYESQLDEAKASGRNLFNDAYNITQRTFINEYRKREKAIQHLRNIEAIVKTGKFEELLLTIDNCITAKQIFEAIKGLNFFGPFLSGQCLTDISYIKDFCDGIDFDDWYPVGPGAKGGLDSYSACVVSDYEVACKGVWKAQEQMFRELHQKTGKDWFDVKYDTPYRSGPYLSLNNIQSAFCEFRKWLALKNGHGRKRYYKGEKHA